MRTPTLSVVALRWHTAALNGERPQITSEPQPGFYKVALVKKAAQLVPARIWLEARVDDSGQLIEDERLCCEIDGTARDPDEVWLSLCRTPITEREFNYLTRLRQWQRVNARDEFEAAWQPVNHLRTPVLEE